MPERENSSPKLPEGVRVQKMPDGTVKMFRTVVTRIVDANRHPAFEAGKTTSLQFVATPKRAGH